MSDKLRTALKGGGVNGVKPILFMGGPFPPSELFRSIEKPMGWPTGMGPRGRFR